MANKKGKAVPEHLKQEMLQDAAQEEAEAAKKAGNVSSEIVKLAEEMAECQERKESLEAEAKQYKDRFDQIRKTELPEAMRRAGLVTAAGKGSFTCSVGRVHLEGKLYASINGENFAKFEQWARQNGAADIIKPTVNAQTLSAFVRELRAEEKPTPPGVSTFEETVAKLTRVKKKE